MNHSITTIKRDGKKETFKKNKIRNAVISAGASEAVAIDVAQSVEQALIGYGISEVSIGEIQTLVEKTLMQYNQIVAIKYIEYRSERDRIRESKSDLTKSISGLINKTDKTVTNENANKDANVFPTQRDLLAGIISKHFARTQILPKHVVDGHDAGKIHYHDLDYAPFMPMSNCCLVDLDFMLRNGFNMGSANVETPKSIGVACAIMSQLTAQVASHQYGGTTFANVDKVLSPYVKATYNKNLKLAEKYGIPNGKVFAEELTEKETYDAFQAYGYEILTLFSTNGQSPFVTLTFGMETSWEGTLIQKAILKNRIEGIGKDKITPTFPKLVMFIEEGINLNKEDVNYDVKKLAVECASKRFYPDIINAKVNREITGSSIPVSPMGCRSFLSVWKDENGNEVLDGRNNLGVISINLPRIALDAGRDLAKFDEVLEERLQLAKDALMTRIDQYDGVTAAVAPILYTEGAFGVKMKPTDHIIDLFKNGRASISMGYVGLHETLVLLTGEGMHQSDETHKLGQAIVKKLKDATEKWKKETGFGFGLYATPAESLCYRFARLDKEVYGEIDGVNTMDYYTNSHHVDVTAQVTPFEKIDLEKVFPPIANGGNISYVEFPNVKNNLEGLEAVWDYMIKTGAHYFGTNTPSDTCFECKFEGEMTPKSDHFECPQCGNTDGTRMNAIRRTCGYLGTASKVAFNHGKQQEMTVRYKHFKGNGQL